MPRRLFTMDHYTHFLIFAIAGTALATPAMAGPCEDAQALASSADPGEPCWQYASSRYGIPVLLLQAIAKTESNNNPRAVRLPFAAGNRDASCDFGLLQANSSHLPRLANYGIGPAHLFNACTNLQVGAWILADLVAQYGWSWNTVGRYNTGNCPHLSPKTCTTYRMRYAWRVYRAMQALNPGNPVSPFS